MTDKSYLQRAIESFDKDSEFVTHYSHVHGRPDHETRDALGLIAEQATVLALCSIAESLEKLVVQREPNEWPKAEPCDDYRVLVPAPQGVPLSHCVCIKCGRTVAEHG